MQLKEVIKRRHSTRKFHYSVPSWKKVIQAIDSARFAPMAGNMYSLKFILTNKKEKINLLADACQQDFVRKAPYVLVVVSDRDKVDKLYDYEKKGFAQQQAGAAIQNVLLSLEEKKLATCWIGMFDDKSAHKALDIPDKLTIEAFLPIGIASKAIGKRVFREKPELENVLYFNKWKGDDLGV
jgi:nitroreductase